LTSTGSDDAYTRIALANGTSGGWTVSGGNEATIFNGSTSDSRTLASTLSTAGIFTNAPALTLTPGKESGATVTGTQTPIGVAFTYSAQVFNGTGTYSGGSAGNWSNNANWGDSNGVAAAPGTFLPTYDNTDTANIGGVASVVVDTAVSLKNLNLSGTGTTLSGSTLTFKADSGNATIGVSAGSQTSNTDVSVTNSSDSLSLNGPVTGGGDLNKYGAGKLVLSSPSNNYNNTAVSGGTLELTNPNALPSGKSLAITGGSSVVQLDTSSPLPSAILLSDLNIDNHSTSNPNATLDLGNGKVIIVDKAVMGSNAMAVIEAQVKAAYGASGTWTGNGITSSLVAKDYHDNPGTAITGIGYADNSDAGLGKTTWGGHTVTTSAALIGYTYLGDANLDGTVDIADFGLLRANFGASSGVTWDMGDFTYDGTVDINDFGRLRAAFGDSLPAVATPSAPAGLAAVQPRGLSGHGAVPEPGTWVLLAGGLLTACTAGLLRRRKRSR
ncbi:MAG: PEP-CTERM sorting domain-containing protein, partial [Tepidisphaeraceae bacterium]